MPSSPDPVLFIGRFHLLLLHLPIGLLLLLAVLELLARCPRFKQANASAGYILGLAVPASLGTVVCGWLLAARGGYDESLLQWHRWLGVAAAAGCALAALMYWLHQTRLYRWTLVITTVLLIVAGHNGGTLTHGRGYLLQHAPAPLRQLLVGAAPAGAEAPPDSAVTARPVFTGIILPLLERNCAACHGPEKAKGKLRTDSLAALLQGGEAGPALVAGKAADSLLIQRIELPLDHDDHMPPEGKPQPSAGELALLKWWIDAGALGEQKLADLNPPAAILDLLKSGTGTNAPSALPPGAP